MHKIIEIQIHIVKLTKLKGEIDKYIIIVEDFHTVLWVIYKLVDWKSIKI